MKEKIEKLKERYRELESQVSSPELIKDQKRYKTVMQEFTYLQNVVKTEKERSNTEKSLSEAKSMLESESDAEMAEMAKEEVDTLTKQLKVLTDELTLLLIPPDPLNGKNIIMEIRAGTGGDESALFAADLYRMYTRFAEERGWKTEVLDANTIEIGGFKEVVFSVSGKEVYGSFRYESGVHRVQRIPATESGGRIHTSAITVAVLPEAEETEIDIKDEDIRIDVFRSSGPGGQSVNTTDSAVRITHIATGTVVSCQDEKSQIKNKAKAMRVLRARLYELEETKRQQERASDRKKQIGSGDRSERIRTYNFPQNRVTDHRINLTLYKLDAIMEGALEELIKALRMSQQEEDLRES